MILFVRTVSGSLVVKMFVLLALVWPRVRVLVYLNLSFANLLVLRPMV